MDNLFDSNFNNDHPEIKDGEVFIMNVKGVEELENTKKAPFMQYRRLGETAYDNNGNIVEGFNPMFALLKD